MSVDQGRDKSIEIQRLRNELARKEQEVERLRVGHLFLKTVFDGISEEIMVVDQDFNIREANRVMLDRYNLQKDAIRGRKCYHIKKESGAPCHTGEKGCPLYRVLETGKVVETVYQHRDLEGREREISLIMYPVDLPGSQGMRYFMEIARDETRYHKLIKKLKLSEERFSYILNTATNAILSIDENHCITLFNKTAERIFGYSHDEVLGRDLGLLVPKKYGDHRRFVQRFLERREPSIVGSTIALTARRKNGEEFPIELSLSFLELESGITITAIIRDVTERKKLEKRVLQNERLAAVGEAVAHVVHELKNPLMIIGGFTSRIRNHTTDENTLMKLDMILDEVGRVERLVAELGDFTKEYRLILRPADVNSVLKDVVRVMGAAYPAEKYVFVEDLDPGLGEISCDPDKLKQVFINIISNGIEAMPDGGVITVRTVSISEGVEIRISDQGRGIPEVDLGQIFEPFFTTRERGSGLGLAISYKIVHAHAGELSAVSRPGSGATFVIRLPRS